MATLKFNVNNYVRVKLTDTGKTALRKWHLDLMGGMEHYREPTEDAEGWSRWQLWELMMMLGPACSLGFNPPFETTIEIIAD